MINDHVLKRFETLDTDLLKPIYADYSFANIPTTAHFLLTGEQVGPLLPVDCFGSDYPRPRRVVLFFVDSFGWEFWQRYTPRSRIMRRVVEQGILTPISALFPSTTSASVTTMNFGVLPAIHGIYEWFMYVPAYGEVIQTLPFAPIAQSPGKCVAKGYDPQDMLLVRETMHQRLARHGVRSIQIAHGSYAHSPYNALASAGAEIYTHQTLAEAVVDLKRLLDDRSDDKAFVNFYWAGLDTSAHIHGPGSPQHEAEVIAFWATLDALLDSATYDDTLFLFTADHGHARGDAAATIYVNERLPWLRDALAVSPTGETIWPNGAPRDMFLHIKSERRAEVLDALRHELQGLAHVLTVDDALAAGLFGPKPVVAEMRRRLGDILVLARANHFIWWREPRLIGNRLHGHHGGLTATELITVLGVSNGL